jgi:hypothetical protein
MVKAALLAGARRKGTLLRLRTDIRRVVIEAQILTEAEIPEKFHQLDEPTLWKNLVECWRDYPNPHLSITWKIEHKTDTWFLDPKPELEPEIVTAPESTENIEPVAAVSETERIQAEENARREAEERHARGLRLLARLNELKRTGKLPLPKNLPFGKITRQPSLNPGNLTLGTIL